MGYNPGGTFEAANLAVADKLDQTLQLQMKK